MKNNNLITFIALSLGIFGSAANAFAATTVFINVNVLSMRSEQPMLQQSVVVTNGRISAIGDVDTVPVPKHALVVDGTDRFLMPGLAEMHAHVTSTTPRAVDRMATLFVANGITTIRGMLGRESHLRLRDQLDSGAVFGPRLITSGPSLNGRSVSGTNDAERHVRNQHAAGYDFIKIHPGLSRSEFVAIAETANALKMPFAGHVPADVGVDLALQNKMATIDHLDGYFAALLAGESTGVDSFFDVMLADHLDAERIPAIAAATREAKVWNVPTETLVEQLIDVTPVEELARRPESQYVTAATLRIWIQSKQSQLQDPDFDAATAARAIDLRRRLILELHRAGAGLLLGSDAPQTFNVPGYSLHHELRALVAAGLTPYEALRTGTANVAMYLGSNGGYVEVGKDADLVLLDANPLLDINDSRRIHGVMLRGEWLASSELEKRLSQYAVRKTN